MKKLICVLALFMAACTAPVTAHAAIPFTSLQMYDLYYNVNVYKFCGDEGAYKDNRHNFVIQELLSAYESVGIELDADEQEKAIEQAKKDLSTKDSLSEADCLRAKGMVSSFLFDFQFAQQFEDMM